MDEHAQTQAEPRKTAQHRLVDTFVTLYGPMLQRLSGRLRNPEDARDALQNAFIKCWQNRRRIGHVRHLAGWVWQVSINAARDLVRDAWRRRIRPLEATP